MAGRKRGFTLIELLVVITILVMLMTLLLPAVLKARLVVMGVLTQGRVSALANACEAYHTDYDSYPTIIDDPPGTSQKLTGSQNLRLALLGCARVAGRYEERFNGPADDIDNYGTSRQREPFFTAKQGELRPHDQVLPKPSGGTAYGSIQVVVDQYFSPERPLLYYRAQPRYVNPQIYEFDDNSVYCDPTSETESKWKSMLGDTEKKGQAGFFIVNAGADRIFFTSDDITNQAK